MDRSAMLIIMSILYGAIQSSHIKRNKVKGLTRVKQEERLASYERGKELDQRQQQKQGN